MFFLFCSPFNSSSLVYHVNWLKAKARIDEELTLVKYEMQWTTLWFQNKAKIWEERSKRKDGKLPLGHRSYAAKQQKLWKASRRWPKKDSNCIFHPDKNGILFATFKLPNIFPLLQSEITQKQDDSQKKRFLWIY